MLKLIPPNVQKFEQPQVQMVKAAKSGLRGSDLDKFVKRASTAFLHHLSADRIPPGEIPVHVIAIGAYEKYGPNRNGDAFTRSALKRFHSTFVKFAHHYRDHKNKNPRISYGYIKDSAYNDAMDRVELLIMLNGTKEAARRNKGLVADREIEKLAKDGTYGVSMACHVEYDICLGCGNRAESREEYCDANICKYGGCKENLAKTFDDGFTLCVDNPEPRFFDISHVDRPADRIAWVLGQMESMDKTASDFMSLLKRPGDHRGGAALAELARLEMPTELFIEVNDDLTNARLSILEKLAKLEKKAAQTQLGYAFHPEVQAYAIPEFVMKADIGNVITALTRHNSVLPLPEFLHLVSKKPKEKIAKYLPEIKACLPNIFSKLLQDPDLHKWLVEPGYVASSELTTERLHQYAYKAASAWGLNDNDVLARLQRAMIRSCCMQKEAAHRISLSPVAEKIAKEYAKYEVDFLVSIAQMSNNNIDKQARYIVQMNRAV